jgi:hypothetical protein
MQKITGYNLSKLVTQYIGAVGASDDKLSSLLTVLLSAPSAQKLGQWQTSLLMRDAITKKLYSCAALLLQLPAAQKMGADDRYSALMALLPCLGSFQHLAAAVGLYKQILKLPGLQQAAHHDMFDKCVHELVHYMQKLQLDSGTADAEGGLHHRRQLAGIRVWMLDILMALPAASSVSVAAGDKMLRKTLQLWPAAVRVLCSQLPALQQLTALSISAALKSAVERPEQVMQEGGSCSSETAIGCLCALPGAQQLQPQALQELLERALL